MKTKIIVLLALTAIVTLSFTFASRSEANKVKAEATSKNTADAPAGGFASSEDKF